MLGTIVNVIAIIAGSLIGLLFRNGIPEKYKQTVMQAVGLSVVLIGISGALKTDDLLLVIISLAVGSILGEMLQIENRLEALGKKLGRIIGKDDDGISKGFVTASLVFCIGAMAIVGALESGLSGNHQTLYAKSVLDGISSIIFASTLGVGVLLSALSVLVYQGAITVSAAFIKQFLVPEVVAQMSSVGGLLIMAIGFNLLEMKRIRIGNMLPAILIPLVYYVVRRSVG